MPGERRKDQAQPAQHLAHADEPQEPEGSDTGPVIWSSGRSASSAGEQEEQREQHLDDPQRIDH
jgi:hypothetical protein